MILLLNITCPFTNRRRFDSAKGDGIISDVDNGMINVNPHDYPGAQIAYPLHAVLALEIPFEAKLKAVPAPTEAAPTPIRKSPRKKKTISELDE